MTITARLICLIIAFVFFILAGLGVSAKVSFRDFGYAFVVLAMIVP